MTLVFDAGALVAYLTAEPGAEMVRQLLKENPGDCYAHAINLCEVFYPALRADGLEAAREVIATLTAAGVQARSDMDTEFWESAAGNKAAYAMSLADAFCVALAQRMDAELITSDRHELEPVLVDSAARVIFIR